MGITFQLSRKLIAVQLGMSRRYAKSTKAVTYHSMK